MDLFSKLNDTKLSNTSSLLVDKLKLNYLSLSFIDPILETQYKLYKEILFNDIWNILAFVGMVIRSLFLIMLLFDYVFIGSNNHFELIESSIRMVLMVIMMYTNIMEKVPYKGELGQFFLTLSFMATYNSHMSQYGD